MHWFVLAMRARIAVFLNTSISIASKMWAHCRELRTNPAAKPPKYANKKARLVIIENIPRKFQAWHWDTTDPENCVPMDKSNRFRPTLHGEEFERLCGEYGIRDFQLMHMISQGVDSLTETRPYAVVLNFNYASLAQFYDQILTKAMKDPRPGSSWRCA